MPHVCILGGGYAGLRLARHLPGLLGRSWSITLVDRSAHHQFITRLPELVSGVVALEDVQVAFQRVLPAAVAHRQAEITHVDLESHTVETDSGCIVADVLIYALGSVPDYTTVPGAAEHSFSVKSVRDALRLRDSLRAVRRTVQQPRIVVIGAGYTGIEVAGELSVLTANGGNARPLVSGDIQIVSEDPRLLPHASPALSDAVAEVFLRRGVPVALNRKVARVDAQGLVTGNGERFDADLVVWAGQTAPARSLTAGFPYRTEAGKFKVDPYLQFGAKGGTFVCGDAAEITDFQHGGIVASSAQLALQEADTIGRNMYALQRSLPLREFRPRVLGEALLLGGNDAVAEVGGVILTGRAGAAVKTAALKRYLAGLGLVTPSLS